jgi:hypothetical protein
VIGGENAFGLGGYRGTALEDLLPVTLAGEEPDFIPGLFRPKPNAASHPLVRLYETPEASASAWESLPPMDGFARFHSVRPGSGVLAVHPREKTETGEPLPILAMRNYGRGKVLLVSSDSTWRWRLGAGADYRIASFYPRFWSRAVEYLTGNLELSKVKFSPLPDRLPAREPAVFFLRVFDESFRAPPRGSAEVSVLWTGPDGKTREVLPSETEPGLFPVELTGLSPGNHHLKAVVRLKGRPWGEGGRACTGGGGPPEAPMDRLWLKRVADLTSGEMTELAAADGSRLLGKLPAIRSEAEILGRAEPWSASVWLYLTLACLLAEWGLRRWRGFP